jgi:hypothetical protein
MFPLVSAQAVEDPGSGFGEWEVPVEETGWVSGWQSERFGGVLRCFWGRDGSGWQQRRCGAGVTRRAGSEVSGVSVWTGGARH